MRQESARSSWTLSGAAAGNADTGCRERWLAASLATGMSVFGPNGVSWSFTKGLEAIDFVVQFQAVGVHVRPQVSSVTAPQWNNATAFSRRMFYRPKAGPEPQKKTTRQCLGGRNSVPIKMARASASTILAICAAEMGFQANRDRYRTCQIGLTAGAQELRLRELRSCTPALGRATVRSSLVSGDLQLPAR